MVRFADAVPVEVRPARLAPDKQWTEEDLGHIRDVLSDWIRRHMMSDVPVGVFLSGGLDSAIVAAIAAKVAEEKGERLPTFAVGTEGWRICWRPARWRSTWAPSTTNRPDPRGPRGRARRGGHGHRALRPRPGALGGAEPAAGP